MSFFKNVGWINYVVYLVEKINFNVYDIVEIESYDIGYNDEFGVVVGVDDICGNEMGGFVYKMGNVEMEEID